MSNQKYYATINRSGTQVRIKDKHRFISAYLNQRAEKLGPLRSGGDQTILEFVKKEDWQKIAGELKIGFQENFTQITTKGGKFSSGLIIANEEGKKETLEEIKFVTKAFQVKKEHEERNKSKLKNKEEEE